MRFPATAAPFTAANGPENDRMRTAAWRWPARGSAYLLERRYFVDGNEKMAPSRTPADGQRCVIVFRFV